MAVPSVDVAAMLAVDARSRGRPSIGSADQRPHQGVELREQWLQVCRVVDAPRLHRTGAAVVWQGVVEEEHVACGEGAQPRVPRAVPLVREPKGVGHDDDAGGDGS